MSRFVSGGTIDEPVERDDAWLKAQQEIEAKRRQKEEESKQEGGKSLYETLQANKAAKQEAFEETSRLSNQFRSLDEDEVEFLDSVLESTRAKEQAVKKETAEQLDLFRRQQEETEKAARAAGGSDNSLAQRDTWAVGGRKRKKGREKEAIPGLKIRKTSSVSETQVKPGVAPKPLSKEDQASSIEGSYASKTGKDSLPGGSAAPSPVSDGQKAASQPAATPAKPPSPPAASLGLGGYSSDED
ncbi:hypothetical protein M8818_006744 [Zalaria obscura]|uniref:Uncharacterized protein n=1 Tax=Zalaria obscura TaxID=2024903 RepID=A0ACC3S6N4_9PEZI